jgi:hypothetical protein
VSKEIWWKGRHVQGLLDDERKEGSFTDYFPEKQEKSKLETWKARKQTVTAWSTFRRKLNEALYGNHV